MGFPPALTPFRGRVLRRFLAKTGNNRAGEMPGEPWLPTGWDAVVCMDSFLTFQMWETDYFVLDVVCFLALILCHLARVFARPLELGA